MDYNKKEFNKPNEDALRFLDMEKELYLQMFPNDKNIFSGMDTKEGNNEGNEDMEGSAVGATT